MTGTPSMMTTAEMNQLGADASDKVMRQALGLEPSMSIPAYERPPAPSLGEELDRFIAALRRGIERATERRDNEAAAAGAALERVLLLSVAPERSAIALRPPTPPALKFGDASSPSLEGNRFDCLRNDAWLELREQLVNGLLSGPKGAMKFDTMGQLIVVDAPAIGDGGGREVLLRWLGRFQGIVCARTEPDRETFVVASGLRAVLKVGRRMDAAHLEAATAYVIREAAAVGITLAAGPSTFAVAREGRSRLAGTPISFDDVDDAAEG